ncbi:MAG: radical SAM protein [Syntrophobacteraceae bacterium]
MNSLSTAGSPAQFETDLLLVFPPFYRLTTSMENVGIEYIAAYARAKGFRTNLINAGLHGFDTKDVLDFLSRSRFRVLGLSTIHWNLPSALTIARSIRVSHPHCHIILGGVEAALNAEAILTDNPYVDSICMGEGEITMSALLAVLTNGGDRRQVRGLAYRDGERVRFTEPEPLMEQLDSLPFPARDDMAAVLELGGPVSISSSRGCFGRCSFCSVRSFYDLSPGPSWRGRSPASVVEEIREIHLKSGATLFSFIDETVMGPGDKGRERVKELARLIKRSGLNIDFFMTFRADQVERSLFGELKQAGLRKVELGIESIVPEQLRRYGKSTRADDNRNALEILEELGIAAEIFMIPFDSYLTAEEFRQNLSFYRSRFEGSRGYDVAPLSLGNYLYPYPGTEARRIYERNGWVPPDGGSAGFRSSDENIQRVAEAVIEFTSRIEPAFPMSYAGLGNLWINSLPLPEPVYLRVCEICGELGILLVNFSEWSLSVVSESHRCSAADVERIVIRLLGFARELETLRRNSLELTGNWERNRLEQPLCAMENQCAEELHCDGNRKRELNRLSGRNEVADEDEIVMTLLNILVKEPWR